MTMLKFATKKPPRYKHYDQGYSHAHREGEGCYYGDEGESYLRGDYTRFDKVNGDDMVDYDNYNVDYSKNVMVARQPYAGYRDGSYSTGRGYDRSSPGSRFEQQGRRQGVVGFDLDNRGIGDMPERQVGMSRNGHEYGGQRSHEVGQRSPGISSRSHVTDERSQFNPGYIDNTLENRRQNLMDVNRNPYPQHGLVVTCAPQYTKGSGYSEMSPGSHSDMSRSYMQRPEYSAQRQHYDHTRPHYQESLFSAPSLSNESNGHYGLDSTASMSIDSMSASGDRSSKSTAELQDYDLLMEMPQVTKRGLDIKPPVPHKQKHVHIGRGMHGAGVCEGSLSPVRPGSTEGQMTSSLRKSPSGMKSGHHVRWGPGVVNSEHKQTLIPISQLQPSSPTRKGKKKTSLRSLLNLPKFPLSDDEGSDTGSSPGFSSGKTQASTDNRGSLRKFLDSHSGSKRKSPVAVSQPVTTTASELASLKYMQEFQDSDLMESSHLRDHRKTHIPKLNVTKANQQNAFYSTSVTNEFDPYVYNPDYDMLQHTDAISYPIMHSRKDQSNFVKDGIRQEKQGVPINRSPVNSVRPFLINGQAHELQDYDNYEESGKQPQGVNIFPVSPNTSDINTVYHGNVSSRNLSEQKMQGMNERPTAFPHTSVTFDTFVTHGRPTESSVTFDTFVTLGRPFATSTPVPNGHLGYLYNVGHQFPSNVHGYRSDRAVGDIKKGYDVTSGQASPSVTQSWKYSVGFPHQSPAPGVRDAVLTSGQVPTMQASAQPAGTARHVTSPAMSHDSHVTSIPIQYYRMNSGPYDMDNKEYGKLSVSPTTFMMRSPDLSPQLSPEINLQSSSISPSNQMPLNQYENRIGSPGNKNLQFRDKCRYVEHESTDYDDDVFVNLGLSPTPMDEASRRPRRKLDYGQFMQPQGMVSICGLHPVFYAGFV